MSPEGAKRMAGDSDCEKLDAAAVRLKGESAGAHGA
jgi:hypothetical protein